MCYHYNIHSEQCGKKGGRMIGSTTKEKPAWKRLLAQYPELKFDRSIAASMCEKHAFGMVLEKLDQLPEDAAVQDLLALFRHDSSREEFLWYYIEAVTGEKDMDLKTY